jgi:hypothetical protein
MDGHHAPCDGIESGRTEPCLGSLATLARAFGLGLAELLKGCSLRSSRFDGLRYVNVGQARGVM